MVARRWAFQTAIVYACLLTLTWAQEQKGAHAAGGFGEFEQRSFKQRRPSASRGKATYQKIERIPEGYSLEYGFKNYNGDILKARAKFNAEVVADSIREFGFRKSDLERIDRWYDKARKLAIAETNKFLKRKKFKNQREADMASREAQKSLDRELELLAKSYRTRRVTLYEKAGFRMKGEGVIEGDIPKMVRRNWKRMRPMAQSFNEIAAKHNYEAEDLVGAVTAMVQTSIRYEIPDTSEGTRTIGGLLPPLKALVTGQGDCDTKTAVIASILTNWPNIKMVGLGIPGHYLMAFHQIPRRGDIFIEYKGLQYVMIESAGPAWLRPGNVGDSTLAYLKAGKNFRIQPM